MFADDMSQPNSRIKIALDVFGGDNAPDVCIDGALKALEEDPSIEIFAVGKREVVESLAKRDERIVAVPASEVIGMDEHPVDAIRSKKDSSIVVCAKLLKDKKVDGFFSAGSTGAVLAAATLLTGRIKGVKRPAIGAVLPAEVHDVLLIDVGANADVRSDVLLQFARLGSVYAKKMMGIENPQVALLNVGSEETKGNKTALEAYTLLRDNLSNFAGNCEGTDILTGKFDVIVCDGFSGNIALKTIEGTGKYMMKVMKSSFLSGLKEKFAALLMKSSLKDIKGRLDSEAQGGSPLLGVDGSVVIGHGSSGPRGIKNGILETAKTIRAGLEVDIKEAISQ